MPYSPMALFERVPLLKAPLFPCLPELLFLFSTLLCFPHPPLDLNVVDRVFENSRLRVVRLFAFDAPE